MFWLKSQDVSDYQAYDSIPTGSEFSDSGGSYWVGTDWIRKCEDEIREELAELEHEQWAHWTKYMLDNLSDENIEQWKQQILTPYEKLSEEEKESDREWADKVLVIMKSKETSE